MTTYGYSTQLAEEGSLYSCNGCTQSNGVWTCKSCTETGKTVTGVKVGDGVVFATTVVKPITVTMNRGENPNQGVDSFSLKTGDNVIINGYIADAKPNGIMIRWYGMQRTTGFNTSTPPNNAWVAPDAIIGNQYGKQFVGSCGGNKWNLYQRTDAITDVSKEAQDRIAKESDEWRDKLGFNSKLIKSGVGAFSPEVPEILTLEQWNKYIQNKQIAHFPNGQLPMSQQVTTLNNMGNDRILPSNGHVLSSNNRILSSNHRLLSSNGQLPSNGRMMVRLY